MWKFIYKKMKEHYNAIFFDEKVEFTYQKVIDLIIHHAKILRQQLAPKSRCGILCDSGINCAISILACWCANMIPVPMSINYGEHYCRKIIQLTQPCIVITDNFNSQFFQYKYNLIASSFFGNQTNTIYDVNMEDVAIIMCTSGTTGVPKGALITKNALKQNISKIAQYFDINYNDRIMIARPLYHCAVLTGEFLIALFNGLDIGFFNEKYNPNNVLQFVIKNKISVLCGTPTLFNHLSIFIQRNDIENSIKKIVISGECLNKKIAANIRKGFVNTKIYNVYGLTEASPRVSYLPPEKFDDYPESVGIPLNDIQIKIVDIENMNKLPAKSHGLIMVKTPCIMKGYYKSEKNTNDSIVDGWLNTGDIGYKDENDYLYILSRADDMIIKCGMNIYPKEIENQIALIDQIQECVVYGVKTDTGQAIATNVVLKDEKKTITKKELLNLFASVLPSYQMPSEINIVTSLKRNASGKIVRVRM